MSALALTLAALVLASPAPAAVKGSASSASAGRAWRQRQTWPLFAQGHLSSLGVLPTGRHGGGALGTELVHVRRRIFRLVQPMTLGYTAQRPLMHGPILASGVTARWLAPFGLFGGIGLSLGAQHVFAATRTYAPDGDRFVASPDVGRAHARIGLAVELGYELASMTRVPLRVFVGWEQRVLTPFAPRNALPLMPQATVIFGLGVHLREARP